MELMAKGDLKTVLRNNRPKKTKPSDLTMRALGQMGLDIAEGMEYVDCSLGYLQTTASSVCAQTCCTAMCYKGGDAEPAMGSG